MTLSLESPQVQSVLQRLHAHDGQRLWRFVPAALPGFFESLLGRAASLEQDSRRFRKLAIGLTPAAARFAYLVARASGARRIVEFGTSLGISTIHFAAAVADNGGGRVIGSEIEPEKARAARDNLAQAGLADFVEVREGDARTSLADPGGPVDLLLLDGMKTLYLDILHVIEPFLRPGAIVLADNIHLFRRALRPYVEHVTRPGGRYTTETLSLGSGLAVSVRS